MHKEIMKQYHLPSSLDSRLPTGFHNTNKNKNISQREWSGLLPTLIFEVCHLAKAPQKGFTCPLVKFWLSNCVALGKTFHLNRPSVSSVK
jgi:hypothetical protein